MAHKQITKQHDTPIDYNVITADSQVISFGDDRFKHTIRDHLCDCIPALKKAGITHFAVGLSTKTDASVPIPYRKLYQTISHYGIKVVPVDIDQSTNPSREEREAYTVSRQTLSIYSRIQRI
jgi:hypothetical protein